MPLGLTRQQGVDEPGQAPSRRAAALLGLRVISHASEALDLAVYEGWDFDRVNREARRVRELARKHGHDAVVSRRRGSATAVGRSVRRIRDDVVLQNRLGPLRGRAASEQRSKDAEA